MVESFKSLYNNRWSVSLPLEPTKQHFFCLRLDSYYLQHSTRQLHNVLLKHQLDAIVYQSYKFLHHIKSIQ